MLGQYKIMNGAGTRDYPTNILEILCGIIIRISAHRSSDITSRSVSISNFFSKYHSMSCVFGPTDTIRLGRDIR